MRPGSAILGALLSAAGLLLLAGSGTDADAAGRRPFGGQLRVAVSDFAGLADPQRAKTPAQRLAARLGHCGLFSLVGGSVVPELAAGRGVFRKGTLTVRLIDGATFHDGAVVTSADVIASLEGLRRSDARALPAAWADLSFTQIDDMTLEIKGPRGTKPTPLRRLLARAEAVVLRGGKAGPSRGCGPFRASSVTAGRVTMDPHKGYARGRPWLDRIVLVRKPRRDDEIEAMVFGDVDVVREPSPRYKGARQVDVGGLASLIAIPAARHRSDSSLQLRRAVASIAHDARLARYVDWPATAASRPWPDALSAAKASHAAPVGRVQLDTLTIAYPRGNAALEGLARALRDALRPLSVAPVRALAVADLTVQRATSSTDSEWDFAIALHEWAANTRGEAALEAAGVFGAAGFGPRHLMNDEVRAWGDSISAELPFVAILHFARPLFVRSDVLMAPGATGMPDYGRSWVRPKGADR